MSDRVTRIASILKDRLGELVSDYELRLAQLRAEAAETIENLQSTISKLEAENSSLQSRLEEGNTD